MKTLFLFAISLFIIPAIHSQTIEEIKQALEPVSDSSDVDSLKLAHPDWKIWTNTTTSIGIKYDSTIYNTEIGESCMKQDLKNQPISVTKVLSRSSAEICKVQYIFLDGRSQTSKSMNTIQNELIARYNEEGNFTDLVKKYSAAPMNDGYLDWFPEGVMEKDFYLVANKTKVGEIAKAAVKKNDWYFVLLKHEANKVVPTAFYVSIRIE